MCCVSRESSQTLLCVNVFFGHVELLKCLVQFLYPLGEPYVAQSRRNMFGRACPGQPRCGRFLGGSARLSPAAELLVGLVRFSPAAGVYCVACQVQTSCRCVWCELSISTMLPVLLLKTAPVSAKLKLAECSPYCRCYLKTWLVQPSCQRSLLDWSRSDQLPALFVGPARLSPAASAFGGTCLVQPSCRLFLLELARSAQLPVRLVALAQPAASVICGTCPVQPSCRR